MAKLNAIEQVKKSIRNKEQELYINWVNFPEYLIKKFPDAIKELRLELIENGYIREESQDYNYNYPQETWILK